MLGRYRVVLRRPSFRWFWLGFTFSEVGDVVTRVALTWFVYERTRSPEALGWLAFCYTGPVIVGGLGAGLLLDRFDRRRVMIADNALRGLAVALIPLLHALGVLAIWHIYAVAAVYGLLMMISLAGGPSLIPALVDEEHIPTANALETVTFTLAGVVGPVLAGEAIHWMGAPTVVLVDVASYFFFVIALARIDIAPVADDREADADPSPSRLGDAVRLVVTDPILRSTTLMFMLFNIGGGGALSVWLPIVADQTPGGGSEMYGWLLGAMALGEVVSAVVAGSRTFTRPLGTLICLGQIAAGAALALLVIDRRLWTVMLGLLLFGAFSAPLTIWAQTLRMQIIPERMRGRVFALLRMVMQSGAPIGGALAGVLLSLVGLTKIIACSALLVGVPGLVGARVRALREAGARQRNRPFETPVS
jgi:MFS family permease